MGGRGHPEPSGQGPSSEARGERGEDLSEFDSPGQIRVPLSPWPEPSAEKAKIFNGDTLEDSYFGNINPTYLPCESREALKAVSVSAMVGRERIP
jgi:hypothetical protein